MTEQRTVAPSEDAVCGMTVDPAQAPAFRDGPGEYLNASYTPSM